MAATDIARKRALKDLNLLQKNQEELNSRGIYFHFDESNIFTPSFLIIPKHKQDLDFPQLTSPYTNGFFLFKLTIPDDFPLSPPKIEFHPQQSVCRLHPNYYEHGKVCLSVINTWSRDDWAPTTSLMAISNILEERFNERAICFEPGCEQSGVSRMKAFNEAVRFGVYHTAILPIIQSKNINYKPFEDIIQSHWQKNKQTYLDELQTHSQDPIKQVKQDVYGHNMLIDWRYMQCQIVNVSTSSH